MRRPDHFDAGPEVLCERDGCLTPYADVRNYYETAPFGSHDPLYLCANCTQNTAEQAEEIAQDVFQAVGR